LGFVLGPVGWAALVVVGASSLAIISLEQATLMGVTWAKRRELEIGLFDSLRFAATRAKSVLELTARIVGWCLLIAAPFLVAIGAVYLWLLSEHDINFYLAEKPSEFQLALVLAGLLVAVLAVILVHRLIGWAFALPILLFRGVSPAEALQVSRSMVAGNRRTMMIWLVGWGAAGVLVTFVLSGGVGFLGRALIPRFADSLVLLVPILGFVMLLWALVNVVTSLFSAVAFSLITVNLYEVHGGGGEALEDWLGGRAPDSAATVKIRRRALVWGGVAAFVVAAVVAGLVLREVTVEDNVQVTAHRGAAGAAPENTMAAFHRALEDGADWVEIDVQETADGQVVVMHDSDFKKVAGNALKIWDANLADLEDIDIGSWFAPEFADERVPLLSDVLEACKGKAGVTIELKYYGHDEQLEQRVIDIVEELDMASEIVVMSLKQKGVERVQALRPDWTVGLLAAVAVGDLTKIDVDFLAVSDKMATRSFVRSAQKAGKEVHVWTINDAVGMSSKFGLGIDNVITDEPALARTVLAQRAEMSSAERLLVGLATYFGATPKKVLTEADA
jgi:glycerophosphoryl diester phosphodiesterase